MEKATIESMELKDVKYLVLHRGLMLNEIELQYGQVYDAEVFVKVPQHTLIGMIMAGWLYRGTEQDVERMQKSREEFKKINTATINQEKQMQVKEIKRMSKKTI